ncbi:WD40 repeat domain-containing protein [Nonomuraea pusilla]|uniref:WD40 repeat n=1 Tax=Nonomuraea pusilla TaxID=46177 RepID=A0A1H7Q9T3_9ACTN|nr:WD40 repeat domain-containing protein [Nonomuraea pusilla]SEL44245.1 WD40 repeat [Nonomuraea pusilla]
MVSAFKLRVVVALLLVAGCSGAAEPAPVAGPSRTPKLEVAGPSRTPVLGAAEPEPCTKTGGPVKPIKLSSREMLETGGHSDLNSVVFGRLKGKPIAISAGSEGSVRFWKLPSLEPAAKPMKGTRAGYTEIGGRAALFTTGTDGGRLWDLDTRKRLLSIPGRIFAFAFGPGTLYTGHDKGIVRVWSLRTRSLVRQFTVARGEDIDPSGSALAASGSQLISQYGTLRVWNPATGRQVGRPLAEWSEDAETEETGPYFSDSGKIGILEKNGTTTVFALRYGWLGSWDLGRRRTDGYYADQEGPGQDTRDDKNYSSFAVGEGVVLAGENNDHDFDESTTGSAVIVRDARTHRRLRTLVGHERAVTTLEIGRLDGRPVALSGSRDNTIRLWDLTSGRELSRTATAGPVREVTDLALGTVNGRTIVLTAAKDGVLRMWDLKSRAFSGRAYRFAPESEDDEENGAWVSGLAVTEVNGVPVAIVSRDNLKILRLADFTEAGSLPGLRDFQLVRRGGRTAVVARENGEDRETFSIWDLGTRQQLGRLDLDPETTGEGVDLTRLGADAVALYRAGTRKSWDGRTLHVWDIAAGRERPPIDVSPLRLPGEIPDPYEGAFTARIGCDPVVLTHYGSGRVRFNDADTGRPLGRLANLGGTPVLVGTVRGRSIAVVQTRFADGEYVGRYFIRLWDLATRKPLTPELHVPEIQTMALGTLEGTPVLVAAGVDKQVWYWRLTS